MKIVINTCYGGFSLSHEATELYAQKKGIPKLYWFEHRDDAVTRTLEPSTSGRLFAIPYTIPNPTVHSEGVIFDKRPEVRNDPDLIAVIEELTPKKASGPYSELKIVEIPDDVEWQIEEYDGSEWIAEKHRTWR